ncbi:N-acetylglucosamine kinase [Anaerococcus sp. AGMB00486]|uniref:N-acetylglucosamine kinase n=2 Tax=Anaerococcus TaxID=165779 RepID=A0ABX2N8X3_9FIRM|nr:MULTISPECIES: BadF/BadG/BcrA/BcrD ATPase family protein [Anaerococcus]MDY3005899.1 BadF/BadG/BcrA/BcrD ATPase family protein [Anaerococcus porci]MSS77465.1 N-acetylglucosamine kinase [Anaerococcus porci]NVF11133.1 N-acetylglucosamine kinase [Anaerococcus faecalis]
MSIFLGVDGGGTKTDYLLCVDNKHFKEKTNTIHLKQITRDEFSDNVTKAINKLCDNAKIKIEDIDFSFLAIPGYGQYPENEKFMEEFFDEFLGKGKYKMGNDCVNGWSGSLNAQAGINLVLGTGSIAFGVDDKGNSDRSGGWGPFLGDEASAYFIGKNILNLFTKMSDGRIEKTYIYELVKNELGIKDDVELIDIAEKMKRDEIANCARLLNPALEKNDKYAIELLDKVGYEAALTIDSLINKLDFDGCVKVSYSGGVYKLGNKLIEAIEKHIKNNIEIIEPYTTPIEGSLILAKKYYEKGAII